jgi:hypothetical protein
MELKREPQLLRLQKRRKIRKRLKLVVQLSSTNSK